MLSCVLAGLMLTSCVPSKTPFIEISPEPKGHAWWLRANYHPFGKEVRGIPINEINASWCSANEFKPELFPTELLIENNQNLLQVANGSFSVTDKFDGHNLMTAITGVYENCSKEKGIFVLVLDDSKKAGKPVIVFKEIFNAKPTIAYFRPNSRESLSLYWCFECGHFNLLEWSNSKKKFEWANVPESDEAAN